MAQFESESDHQKPELDLSGERPPDGRKGVFYGGGPAQ
jgi:hypothetical protein